MLIRELLASKAEREIVAIRPETTLRETAGKLRRQNVSAILVTDTKDKLLGIVSERDLVRAIWKFGDDLVDRPVSEIMTRSVVTCTPADNVLATLSTMNEWAIRHIPVVEAGGIQAMISIREFELACRHLEIQAHTDELTGLSNRRLFMGVLAKEISRFQRFQTPLSVAMLDIDHFKIVNDNYGHEAGDRVLRALADLMVGKLRPFDEVGRLGGEEFAILFPNTELGEALNACERLLQAIREEEVPHEEGAIHFTVSFGLVCPDNPVLDGGTVLKHADQLLYKAKADGRNRIVTSEAVECFRVMEELKSASG